MADASWKAFERRVAKWFGGYRRGADFKDRYSQAGKNDIILPGWSVEVKLHKRPHFASLLSAVKQAEAAKEHELDTPIAVVKRKYDNDEDTLIIMRRDSFLEHFGPAGKDEE